MMEEIRPLRQEELDAAIDLSSYAFQFELPPEERKKRIRTMVPEETLGYFVEGKMASKLTVLPLRVFLNGESVPMGGVGGVATWPEYRRGGKVERLLHAALAQMKERGQNWSMLYPFSVPFYRKYGWELFADEKRYKIPRDKFPRLPEVPGRMEDASGNYELLNAVYRQWAVRYNGMLDRTESWWEHRVAGGRKPGRALVYRDASGQAQGYVIMQVRDRLAKVHELVALTEEAKRGIWKLLSDHDSMADWIEMTVTADDDQLDLLPEPRVDIGVTPYFMARIVDIVPALREYRFAPGPGAESAAIAVQDEHAPWNEGLYRLEWSAEGTLIAADRVGEPGQGETDGSLPRLKAGIAPLAAMLMGYRRPAALARQGRISGDPEAIELLERRLPVRPTGFVDFF
ncbi:enhanced intracellular survival protein Eis [Paenibacillus thermoaerophilus]|uniref:Enhanced intracellular survival protein Eis n=1 Tax=Paenibacillus thermoaerophilus TaxID=1215385 RepID=A0ABW2V6R4_9BACL|nr:GNAT family N-acetyltransferase [Paenibacillus thermoaerophilus]TMV18546.1 GNAT family N-acetyltransferase [Paenibacillus thermoaerophilus]